MTDYVRTEDAQIANLNSLTMVEHVWIRNAELREEEALEEWQQAHPLRTALGKRLKRLRIRLTLAWRSFLASPTGTELQARVTRWRVALGSFQVACVLALTRRIGAAPPRSLAESLPTKALLQELELRGLDASACVERGDLLEALCGPPPPTPAPKPRTEWYGEQEDEYVSRDAQV